ncbi:MAG: hypothetical protein M1839_003816 [Geoglossum umbratile]|nr:MAG: hypothetical protein M1839_003816 [Geoglossum umbratile]
MTGCSGIYESIVLLSLLSFSCSASYALPTPASKLVTPTILSKATAKCETNADNDLYGQGVRIGLYLQWASGFVLRNLESWETRSRVRTVSNTICAAVVLATVVNVLKGSAMSIDYLLSYYLTVVLFYAESYNLEIRVDNMSAREPSGRSAVKTLELHADLPLVCQNVIFTAFTLFGAWYWLKGADRTSDPICGAHGALLGIFDIRHDVWTRAAAGLAVIAGLSLFMVFLLHLASLQDGIKSGPKLVAIYYARAMFFGKGDRSQRRIGGGGYGTWEFKLLLKRLLKPSFLHGEVQSPASYIKFFGHLIHYFLIFLAGPIIAIVSVERMIAANYLVTTSVLGSAGQVIALFSGITSVLLACWEVAAKWMKEGRQRADAEEPPQNPAIAK